MTRAIIESGVILEGATSGEGIRVRIIREGKGSTATYTREFLEANTALFANRPMYLSHPEDPSKPWKRNVDHIAGRTSKVVEYEIVDGEAGLYTNITPREKYRDLVEEFGDLFGVSVFAPDSNGHEDAEGNYIVESVPESPLISVDLVPAAGAGGRIEALMESIATLEVGERPSTAPVQENDGDMDKEILEAIKGLKDSFDAFIAESAGKQKDEVQSTVNEADKAAAVSEALAAYDAKAKAISEATDLTQTQRKQLFEAAKRGEDITAALAEAKQVIEESKSLVESFEGRTFGAATVEDWKIAGVRL